ncbi:PIR protein [Plasmodium vivax]|uniref:VIR protein n=1 Tax=Plasmodium vivax TaxID=5855 RepID=A0A565A5W4_PLAVI|nr:PIR protein [Plasmodium vivax]
MPICKKYLRFLDNSEVWGGTSIEYDVSLLLNYWLYHNISAIYAITNFEKISLDFGALQMVGYYFKDDRKYKQYYEKFKPNIKIFKEEDWGKRKELYEHYVNYDTIYGIAKGYKEKCEGYYEKIQDMISVYKFFQNKCSSAEYKCPDVFYKCKNKNLESSLEELSCHEIMKAKSVSTSEGDFMHQSPGPEQRPLGPADGPQLTEDQHDSHTEELPETSNIRKNVTQSVLGAAPVLLTATMLYRVCYTPLGPWIRRFGGGKTNNMNAMDTFPPYTQETGDMFSDESANHISYQPM